MQGEFIKFEKNQLIFKEGDPSNDLYYLKSGTLLICTVKGTEVKALAKILPGEFIGELAFFDGKNRSSSVVALEKSELLLIPKNDLMELLPIWYLQMGINLTKKIRLLDQVVQESKLRKFGTQELKPLTIEEQRIILSAITH
jgi:CRP/FNR family cyclic AMP-dependent transcriptional regulator